MTAASKAALRAAMRDRLRALPPAQVAAATAEILDHLRRDAAKWLGAGRTVALFGGIAGEPELLPLLDWLVGRGGAAVYFSCVGDDLVPRSVRAATELARGPFGIWEPVAAAPAVSFAALDVVLTPGLAFGRDGTRLGRGRGYFDRLFARADVRARRIGVGFEFQVLPTVPAEVHDRRVEALCTEFGLRELGA